MDNFHCGGYYFTSNFDSGNLAKVELIKLNEGISLNENAIHAEFNVWTKPDCAGTEFENLNRSWFFFSIYGGQLQTTCKINVVNLNKQSKLFSQGMHPVMRIGETGKWELTKDKPAYFIENDNFTLSFIHKTRNNVDTKYYYAFTFPFTFAECQAQLDGFDKLYQKTDAEIEFIIKRLYNMNEEKSGSDLDRSEESESNFGSLWSQYNPVLDRDTDSVEDDKSKQVEINSIKDLENEIYYHRDVLIRSFEGRRIDLLTITSFYGIQSERETKLENLFPYNDLSRCHKFTDKKIIFVSSRVHPGETPASFVLNGLLKLLLDRKSIVASTLRRMYIFKIVPFLNPDGVFNGCYRSDTLGHNLNRVYLAPMLETQPSIYAVRKLIRYYHHGVDLQETFDNNSSMGMNDSNLEIIESPKDVNQSSDDSSSIAQLYKENENEPDPSSKESSSSLNSDSELLDNKYKDNVICTEPLANRVATIKEPSGNRKVFHETFITELKPIVITPAPISSASTSSSSKRQPATMKSGERTKLSSKINQPTTISGGGIIRSVDTKKRDPIKLKTSSITASATCAPKSSAVVGRKEYQSRTQPSSIGVTGQYRKPHRLSQTGNENINFSNNENEYPIKEASNMFLYIDLHGHASKKGVFMYGNHLPNTPEAVECMLLPKLMSINSHHFHFDACVFSERNMYHKGKRDGLSKEGSGRVAVYKTIGLIKSYTLESNYNTGKYVNLLPPKGKDTISRKTNLTAPKYTPTVFEEVGKALGPSILDLTNSNPTSRLHNSEFKSLQGLRNSLRTEIDKSNRSVITTKVSTVRSKRMKSSASCCPPPAQDALKENKGNKSSASTMVVVKHNTLFGKKENPTLRKKGKILCDVLTATGSKFHDQHVPVPVKRPKVATKKSVTNLDLVDLGDSSETTILKKNSTSDIVSTKSGKSTELTDIDASSAVSVSTASYFDCDPKSMKKFVSTGSLIDSEPCCSRSLTRNLVNVGGHKTKKSNSYAGVAAAAVVVAAAAAAAGNLSTSQLTKKPATLKIRSKFGNASLLKQLRRSSINKDSLKLKKKKMLNSSDGSLKRKKSRVF